MYVSASGFGRMTICWVTQEQKWRLYVYESASSLAQALEWRCPGETFHLTSCTGGDVIISAPPCPTPEESNQTQKFGDK